MKNQFKKLTAAINNLREERERPFSPEMRSKMDRLNRKLDLQSKYINKKITPEERDEFLKMHQEDCERKTK